MTLEYTIDEKDFLTYHLYTTSKSESIKKRRVRNKVLVPIVYLALGLFSLYQDKMGLGIIFIVIGILWYFIYPLWEKQRYVNHFKAFIDERYKNTLGRMATMQLENEYILAKDEGAESKVLTTEIEEINEISSAIFIKLKTAQSIIFPKNKINDLNSLIERLRALASTLNVKYNVEDKWEWE